VGKQKLSISALIGGYLIDAESRRLSEHTIADYKIALRRLTEFLGADTAFEDIKVDDLKMFFAALGSDTFTPRGVADRKPLKLSNKTIFNHHVALCALWTWAMKNELTTKHLMRQVEAPRPEKAQIVPYSEADIRSILEYCDRNVSYFTKKGASTCARRSSSVRDRAIVLLLLDTGIRASEICDLRIKDVDLKNHQISVTGKGRKTRTIPICDKSFKALWKYLKTERADCDGADYVFISRFKDQISRNGLLKLCYHFGEVAGVTDCHPHRFRHTFAVLFLRNGGNVYALQQIMGHETLDTIRIYLKIAEADINAAHKTASPVQNLLK
jgi:site-specific recombinase XerD